MDDIVILAGGECPADLALVAGVPNRADIPYGDKTFLQIAIDAVKPLGEPLIVGGNPDRHPRTTPGGNSFVESLELALNAITTERFLLVFADLPFLTPQSVAKFLELSDPTADVNYPIVPADLCESAYPGLKRTAITLKEGRLTGGNLAFLRTQPVRESLPALKKLYAKRKSPLHLARIMGLKTLALLLKSQLSPSKVKISDFEKAVGRAFNLEVKGVLVPDPAIGTDIDSADQYQVLLQLKNPDN